MVVAGLDPIRLLAASIVIAAGAMVQGSVGFGMGLVAAPLLALIDTRLVPGPIMVSGLLVAVTVAIRDRRAIDFFGLKWGLLGRVAGTAVAVIVMASLPAKGMAVLFGGLVLLAVGLSALGLHVRATKRTLVGAGTLSGFMGTLSSIGAPPMAMLYQRDSGERVRATMSGYLVAGVIISLLALTAAGSFRHQELYSSLLLLPGVIVGFLLSVRAKTFLDRGHTRKVILVISALSSAVVVLRQVLQ